MVLQGPFNQNRHPLPPRRTRLPPGSSLPPAPAACRASRAPRNRLIFSPSLFFPVCMNPLVSIRAPSRLEAVSPGRRALGRAVPGDCLPLRSYQAERRAGCGAGATGNLLRGMGVEGRTSAVVDAFQICSRISSSQRI